MRNEVLTNPDLWICAICQTCTARCPQNVVVGDVLSVIRRLAEKEAHAGNIKIDSPRPLFEDAFLHTVRDHGRLYDIGLAMEYYPKREGSFIAGQRAMMSDYMAFGMRMFFKGKMGPLGGHGLLKGMLASNIKQRDVMKKIFKWVEEKEK